jgi:hypothetical protein
MSVTTPSRDASVLAAVRWSREAAEALKSGAPVPLPPRSKAYRDEDLLEALHFGWATNYLGGDPVEIVRQAIAGVAREQVEALQDKKDLVAVAQLKSSLLASRQAGIFDLPPDLEAERAAASKSGRLPDFLDDPSIPLPVRRAVAESIPQAVWAGEVSRRAAEDSTAELADGWGNDGQEGGE